MMYVFLMLGMTLLGWLVRLMQALRLSVPLPVWGTGSYRVSSMVSGSHHAVGWYFLRTGGTCSIVKPVFRRLPLVTRSSAVLSCSPL